MLSAEDWAEIRRLRRAEGLPIKTIARTLGVSRNTARAALAAEGPPRYLRKPAGSAVDEFEPRVREQLRAVPTMPATVIAERVGWTRGMTVFKERVRELRPACLPPAGAEQLAGVTVDDAHVAVVDQGQDVLAGVFAAQADVVQPAVVAQRDGPAGIDGVVADAVVRVGSAARSGVRDPPPALPA